MEKKIAIIIQARSSSSRLPDKLFKKIHGIPIIEILIQRLKRVKKIKEIILATTKNKEDDIFENICKKFKINIFRGSQNNVLKRFYDAARSFKINIVVRITSDCPFSDPELIDSIINLHLSTNSDYTSNRMPPSFPDGLDVEVINFEQLKNAHTNVKLLYDKEHVTPFIIKNDKIKKTNFEFKHDYSDRRWTVDTFEDLLFLQKLMKNFKKINRVRWKSILNYENKNKKISLLNSAHKRNEGSTMCHGIKKWNFAKSIIPGGNSLLSKRPVLYCPDLWPTYFSKAKNIYVWDLQNNKYLDMSLMGVGTNILGYANDSVNKKVIQSIKKSNMSTLNCIEEVELAQQLIKLHPWAEQVKFARTGGEANLIALRIARCTAKNSNVAICGYHGWHDWYLSANFQAKNKLDGHLLKGLTTIGVDKKFKNSTFTFRYNKIEELKKLIKLKKIGIIFMEVSRNIPPKNNFLKKIRKLADKNNIVLIFDECSSGFRETFGGLHLKYRVNPDICVLGKSLGNGFAISAIIGKREFMNKSINSFISSTFWSDRTGPVAALETLRQMKKIQSWKIISKLGRFVKNEWKKIFKKNNLKFYIYGLDAMPSFVIKSKRYMEYKTYITQEMLKKKILASTTIYLSVLHKKNNLRKYFKNLNTILKNIKKFEKYRISSTKFLETKVSESSFDRLN
jgi:glutamate-1-semialdehyde aminotransferase/spore coat polysaccharide biosynthesis protein SpsF (cytidylyltransferase family)